MTMSSINDLFDPTLIPHIGVCSSVPSAYVKKLPAKNKYVGPLIYKNTTLKRYWITMTTVSPFADKYLTLSIIPTF